MPRTPPLENLKTLMSLESHTPPLEKKNLDPCISIFSVQAFQFWLFLKVPEFVPREFNFLINMV